MNAHEARELSDKNKVIHSRIPHIMTRIAEAGRGGRYLVVLRETSSQDDTRTLNILGYTVSYDSNPDPGHPCSGPETTITW